jgi:hypothetical protein
LRQHFKRKRKRRREKEKEAEKEEMTEEKDREILNEEIGKERERLGDKLKLEWMNKDRMRETHREINILIFLRENEDERERENGWVRNKERDKEMW